MRWFLVGVMFWLDGLDWVWTGLDFGNTRMAFFVHYIYVHAYPSEMTVLFYGFLFFVW